MHGRPPVPVRLLIDLGTQCRIGLGEIRKTSLQRPEIEHGAPHQQRDSPGSGDSRHLAQGILPETRHGIGLRRIADIDQAMRRCRERFRIRFGAANIQTTIDHR